MELNQGHFWMKGNGSENENKAFSFKLTSNHLEVMSTT